MDPFPRHQCLIYDGSPSRHMQSLARTLIPNLKANNRCLYMNSPSMVAGMCSCLAAEGLDVATEIEKGSLILTSDQSHLLNRIFDIERMLNLLESALHDATNSGYVGLWASGDMTWEFGGEINLDKLLEYEQRLDQFMRHNLTLSGICQYHRNTLPLHAIKTALRSHRATHINETLSRLNSHYKPSAELNSA